MPENAYFGIFADILPILGLPQAFCLFRYFLCPHIRYSYSEGGEICDFDRVRRLQSHAEAHSFGRERPRLHICEARVASAKSNAPRSFSPSPAAAGSRATLRDSRKHFGASAPEELTGP